MDATCGPDFQRLREVLRDDRRGRSPSSHQHHAKRSETVRSLGPIGGRWRIEQSPASQCVPMSFLLTDAEFADAAARFQANEVTDELHQFIARLVRAAASNRPLPPSLSPSGAWDADGVEESTHAWWEEKLLRGTLRQAFMKCTTPRVFGAYLEKALVNWLKDVARAKQQPRLLANAQEILESTPERFELYADAASPLGRQWGLVGWEKPEPYTGEAAELLAFVFALGHIPPMMFGDQAQKASPVISKANIRRVLDALFEGAVSLLTLRHVDLVFRERFAEAFTRTVPIDSIPESASDGEGVQTQVDARQVAHQILAELGKRRTRVLLGKYREAKTLEEIGQELGCSRGTVDNELKRAYNQIEEGLDGEENFEIVLKYLLEVASLENA